MTKKPKTRQPSAQTVDLRMLQAVLRFHDKWSPVCDPNDRHKQKVNRAVALAERIYRMLDPISPVTVDAYLRYLAWSVGDLDGVLYEELTRPTSKMGFHSVEFTKLWHAFNVGFYGKFKCNRRQRHNSIGSRVDPEANLGLVCDWLGVDRSDVKRLEDHLCGLAQEHDLNENEVLLARACSSVACPGFLVTIAGEPSCPVIRRGAWFPGPRFPKMTGTITECTPFPPDCGYPTEVTLRWAELRDELDKKQQLQQPSQPV